MGLILYLRQNEDPLQVARDHGLAVTGGLKSDPNAYVAMADRPTNATAIRAALGGDPRIRRVVINRATGYQRHSFTPDDPYFPRNAPAPGWPGQWHLRNELAPGLDAGVWGAWQAGLTGLGVTIGVVDDSLEVSHPDLSANAVLADSWDFGQGDPDPSPVRNDDRHGIAVSGLAAARGGNGIGVTGAAPWAGLAGLRVDFQNQTTAMFVDATLFHSTGPSPTIGIKNHSYGEVSPYVKTKEEVVALRASAASGTIHCFSAGNNRGFIAQDANTLDLQNDPYALCVAALGSNGKFASYSSFGANVICTAPSGSFSGNAIPGLTTTDRTALKGYCPQFDSFPDADYTSVFAGTSGSSPIVAGVMALAREAAPGLNARWAKHLLARTCKVVDSGDASNSSDGGWRANAAGFRFNQNYGFGLIDAGALCELASETAGVTPEQVFDSGKTPVGLSIPNASPAGVIASAAVPAMADPVETVELRVKIVHPRRGDIEIRLISPSGTVSRLCMRPPSDTSADIRWTFLSHAFWGESAEGTWSVRVADIAGGPAGTFANFTLTLRAGSLLPAPSATQKAAP